MARTRRGLIVVAALVLPACGLLGGDESTPETLVAQPVDGAIVVDFGQPLAEISPLIRGVSGDINDFEDAGITLNSWGGQRATRFNYQLGNAWNAGRAGAFRNESVASSDDLVGEWLEANDAASVVSRVAVPALGWMARDGQPDTCSFPDASGTGCLQQVGFDCESPGPIADPLLANVGSSPATVAEWMSAYDRRVAPAYLAVDNEPERWGIDHYDVHPTCTDYFEILGTYVTYASALREVAPSAQLAGPVMCCWYDFASPPGPGDGSDEDLLTWFLRTLSERARDDPAADGDALLDVVDLHYRPQADVVNAQSDARVGAARVDATRELWDPEYRSASQQTIVEFLPRVRRIIDRFFPGMPLMISDWRFGGEDSVSGAVAIFEALGIFAREGVTAAVHAETLTPDSPGLYAFRLFGNYDGRGGAFEGVAVQTGTEQLDDVGAFAAVERNVLRIGVVNRSADTAQRIRLDLGAAEVSTATVFAYSEDEPDAIVDSVPATSDDLVLDSAPMSISLVEVSLRGDVGVAAPTSAVTESAADE